jgi:small GTP-binding protein
MSILLLLFVEHYNRDTAGQERFRSIVSSYYRGTHSVLMVYDMTCEQSLQNCIDYWHGEAQRYCSPTEDIPVILIGNKSDLFYKTSEEHQARIMERANQFALDTNNMAHVQTSAKTGENIEAAFESIVEKMMRGRLDRARALRSSSRVIPSLRGARVPAGAGTESSSLLVRAWSSFSSFFDCTVS